MQLFTERVIYIIRNIPSGQVMTYGQVAAAAGSPRGARQVSRILHSMSRSHNLPWHRVVNAQGKIVILDEEARHAQSSLLFEEGVAVDRSGKVDLTCHRHFPEPQ
ncbi:MAG TPA: MGMT family protein [Planococcus sp. (in: firmicutes)]|nr:MGMT family protein [Planococcus sp. (in: firmicutes)]